MNKGKSFYSEEEIKSRQSMSTVFFWKYRPFGESILKELVQNGITRIELVESREQYDMTDINSMRYISDICKSCGVEIVAYHAHTTNFAGIDTEEKRKKEVDFCRRQLDTMMELGGKVWGSHATTMNSILRKSYEDLARHIEGTDAVIAIENFKAVENWVEKRIAFLDEIDYPQVGMILDIGHVRNDEGINPMTLPGGPARIFNIIKNRLCWVHLHGFKDGIDHYPPFAEGDEIQWVEIFRMLYAIGYSRYFNFEAKGEPKHFNTIQETARAPGRIVELEARTPGLN